MDLGGWDLAFAIDVGDVNAGLKRNRAQLVQSFDFQSPVAAQGRFGDWRIAPGGSGSLLALEITIEEGAMGAGGPSIVGAVLRLQVQLALLAAANGHQLRFDLSSVVFQRFVTTPAGLTEIQAAELGLAFAEDLAKRAGEVTFVLASISPVGAGAPPWLTPVELRFAYGAPRGQVDGALAIFAATRRRDTSRLRTDIDPALVSGGGVGLGLSAELFMAGVFLPALAAGLKVSNDDLALGGAAEVVNKREIRLPGIKKASRTYHPKISTLTATLSDDRVLIAVAGRCDMGIDITMTFKGLTSVGLGLKGSALAFAALEPPSFHKDVRIPPYEEMLLGAVTWVAEKILELTVAEIAGELTRGVSRATTTAICSQAPSIVDWMGSGGFRPRDARLAGGLVLTGAVPPQP